MPLGKELNGANVKQRRAWFSSGCPASQPVGPRPCDQERGASSPGKTGRWWHFPGGMGSLGFTQAQEVHILPRDGAFAPGHSEGFTLGNPVSLGKPLLWPCPGVVRVSELDMRLRTLVEHGQGQSRALLCSPEAHGVQC